MADLSFPQRFGLHEGRPIDDEFPQASRTGLMYVLQQFVEDGLIKRDEDGYAWRFVMIEMLRSSKIPFRTVDQANPKACNELLASMEWPDVYVFCERVFSSLLTEKTQYHDGDTLIVVSLDQVRQRFVSEVNTLLSESNLAYVFRSGRFERPGRPQTQRNVARAQAVLADPALHAAREHYAKAHRFFGERAPDFENSVKEAICALEAALEVKSGKRVSADFEREVAKLSGPEPDKIPPPIAQAMVKIHAYRGGGKGVSHGNTGGLKVTRHEAELVLSAAAAFVTYVVDFYESQESEAPFSARNPRRGRARPRPAGLGTLIADGHTG